MTMFERLPRPNQSEKAKARAQWLMKVRRAATNTALTSLMIATPSIADTSLNKTVEASSEISIDVYDGSAEDENNNNRAIVSIAGYRSRNADKVDKYLGSAVQSIYDAQRWGVNIGTAPLIEEKIGKELIETAEERGVDTLAFATDSLGGLVEINTVNYITEHSDLIVELKVENAMPHNLRGLEPSARQGYEGMELITAIPDFEYWTPARIALGLWFEKGEMRDFESTVSTTTETIKEILLNEAPALSTETEKLFLLETTDIDEHYRLLNEYRHEKQAPVTLQLGAFGRDYMVDDTYSMRETCNDAGKAGLECIKADVEGAIHSRLDINNENYTKTIQGAAGLINDALERARVENFDFIGMPDRIFIKK